MCSLTCLACVAVSFHCLLTKHEQTSEMDRVKSQLYSVSNRNRSHLYLVQRYILYMKRLYINCTPWSFSGRVIQVGSHMLVVGSTAQLLCDPHFFTGSP